MARAGLIAFDRKMATFEQRTDVKLLEVFSGTNGDRCIRSPECTVASRFVRTNCLHSLASFCSRFEECMPSMGESGQQYPL